MTKTAKKPIDKKARAAASPQATSLVLRVCSPEGTSRGGFTWPQEVGAVVKAPDWRDDLECGHGLHGWLFGQGDHTVADHATNKDAKWYVLEVADAGIRMLGGKVKFPEATVRFVGTRSEAVDFMVANEPRALNAAVIGLVREFGDKGVGQGGAHSTLTGGAHSTLTGGAHSTLTGGYGSTLTGGAGSTLTGGYGSTLTGGAGSTLTGGYGSTLTGGYGSILTGGAKAELRFKHWDSKAERCRTVLAYVGEDGIKAGVKYTVHHTGKVVEVKS